MYTQRTADMGSGLVLAALGALSLAASANIKGVTGEHLHPRTLPLLLSAAILMAGLWLAAAAWYRRAEGGVVEWPDRDARERILVAFGSMVIYLILLELLGFSVSSFLFVAFLIWYLGRYRLITIVITAVITAVTFYYLFVRLLGLTLPVGPFGW